MVKINFQNNITKANADTFNTMQDNIENGINDGVIEAKDYADELQTYSTTETRIGTWIDGKPIYRKVIDFGTLPNSTTKSVATGLSNVVYIRYYGYATDGTYYWNLNVPRPISGNAYGIGCYISNNSIVMECGTDKSSNNAYVVVEYTKNSD